MKIKFLILLLILFLAQPSWADGIGSDKIKHAAAGVVLTQAVIHFLPDSLTPAQKKHDAALITLGAACLKEVLDENQGGKFDLLDVAATMFGSWFSLQFKF